MCIGIYKDTAMDTMSKLKAGGCALLLLAVIGASKGAYDFYQSMQTSRITTDMSDRSDQYQAKDEIARALHVLQMGTTPAAIISPKSGTQKVVLVFDGLPDRADTSRLVQVLRNYHVQAVFFVEGQNAIRQADSIELIRNAGYEIENYTFVGMAHVETLSPEVLISQICRTQQVISDLTGTAPQYFRAPETRFTIPLLEAVNACGIGFVVQENVVIPRHSLHTIKEADVLVSSIVPGSIISVAVGVPVEKLKPKDHTMDSRRAKDRKPTIRDVQQASGSGGEERIADEVAYLLEAMQRKHLETTSLSAF